MQVDLLNILQKLEFSNHILQLFYKVKNLGCQPLHVIYNNFAPKSFHIHTTADGQTSFIKEINDAFQKYNILVSVSIQNEVDEIDGHIYEYLVFLS